MTEESKASVKAPAFASPPPAPDVDLSAEIVATIETHAGETVKCVRVYGDSYRCNWWASDDAAVPGKPIPSGLEITALRVHRSSFLKVKRTPQGLHIQDVTLAIPAGSK